ncbi:hypothetical protein POL68_03330 [Stigmatella sp. ncwal1]|uniref:Tetratricopeptide repeat-containing protein n=1 Tax=Stigmatella ashevillensis TaxID=2995309 RepID=A0ABT5D1F4_9BACT|nr:hypothetical protein [Stigmatella ashevillena]MDC0707494.1 hypothetical protein [Stigmatella ashevillena]
MTAPRLLAVLTALLLGPLAWGEAPNADLPRARRLLESLRYAEASRALEAARAQPGNGRDTLLEILELQGVVAAMLQQPTKARTEFQTLLVLAPDRQLKGDYAPRVVTPFFEAKAWVTDQQAALRLEAVPTVPQDTTLERIAVRTPADLLKLGRAVRFHLSEDGAPWRQQESPLSGGQAAVAVKGRRVQWWAELLDGRQAVLTTMGSATAPQTANVPLPQALIPALTSASEGPAVDTASSSPWRRAAYVCLGVAVGSGAVGGYFGLRSRSARADVEGAAVNEQGLTTGLTQKEAYALDDRARSSARLANILLGVAGAATLAGGTFWVLGAPVKVSATPAGVVLQGELP